MTKKVSLNIADKSTFIKDKAQQIYCEFEQMNKICFESQYQLGKELGQGMHATVFKCFKLDDHAK